MLHACGESAEKQCSLRGRRRCPDRDVSAALSHTRTHWSRVTFSICNLHMYAISARAYSWSAFSRGCPCASTHMQSHAYHSDQCSCLVRALPVAVAARSMPSTDTDHSRCRLANRVWKSINRGVYVFHAHVWCSMFAVLVFAVSNLPAYEGASCHGMRLSRNRGVNYFNAYVWWLVFGVSNLPAYEGAPCHAMLRG